MLLWAGAPVPVFKPARSAVSACATSCTRGTRVHCELDTHERPMHCHHEKLVIVDDEVAFVGGIDLTSLGGDRYRHSEHPMRGRLGWHDAASRMRGPAVADVAAHFATAGARSPARALPAGAPPSTTGDVELQVVRTVPERIYDFLPSGDFRILEAYTRALRSAASSSTSRASFSGRRRSSRSSPRSCATPRASASASSCCCRRSRTTAPTTPAASSPR